MKKYLFTLLCAALVLAGCSDIMGPAHNNNAKKEGLKITVSNNTAGSRTMFPAKPNFTKYVLQFENTDGLATYDDVPIEDGKTYAIVKDLAPGTWKITALGYVTIAGTEYPAAEGEATVVIPVSGEYPKEVDIILSAMLGGDPGSFSYKVTFPDTQGVTKASLDIILLDDGSTVGQYDLLTAASSSAPISLASGYYLVTIRLETDNQIAGLNEIVHIYSNLTTEGEFEFTTDDFTSYITLGGTIEISYARDPMPVVVISASAQNEALGSLGLIGETRLVSPPTTNAPWSINVAPFDTPTDISFRVIGYDNQGEVVFNDIITPTVPAGSVNPATGVTNQDVTDIFLKWGNVPAVWLISYKTPKLYNTDDKSDVDYIDPLWDELDWVPVENQNLAETSQDFFDNPSTEGQAKLYWDKSGLWLYVDVKTQNISTNTGYAHDGSSVELFINERVGADGHPVGTTGANAFANGGQYRLDSNGDRTGDPADAVTAFNSLDKFKTWRTAGGYAVMFQAPWRVTGQYPLKDNKEIGLEIQINAAKDGGVGRVGVLKWYNTTGNTYQNSNVLAKGRLAFGGSLPADVWDPIITTQPTNITVYQGIDAIPALTVGAVSPDNRTLTYQWYQADDATGATGTLIGKAVDASYTPPATIAETQGDYYYYVEVTNTDGADSKTKTSNVVKVTVTGKVTVTFDSNEGSEVSDVVIASGAAMGSQYPKQPTRAGYNFDGWWDNATGKEYFAATVVSADTALKAKWVTVPALHQNYEVPLTGKTVINATVPAGNYAAMLTIDVPDIDITKYSGTIIEAKFLKTNRDPVEPTYSNARQLVYVNGSTTATIYNFGVDGAGSGGASVQTVVKDGDIYQVTRPGWAIDGGTLPTIIKQVRFSKTTNDDIAYVQVLSITFIACAWAPVIDTQPADVKVDIGEPIPALTVSATSPDGGELSYQWYSATDATGASPTKLEGATGTSYTPDVGNDNEGDYFYYVAVTNTVSGLATTKNSNVVKLRVGANKFTVTFNKNGATSGDISPVQIAEGQTMGSQYPNPTRTDYQFDGWWDDTTGKEYFSDTLITASVALKAHWATAAVLGKDYTVPLTGQTVKNKTAIAGYAEMVNIDVGSIDITKYSAIIMEVIFSDANGQPYTGNIDYNNAKQLIYNGKMNDGSTASYTYYNFGWNNSPQVVTVDASLRKITITGWPLGANNAAVPDIINKVIVNGTTNTTVQYVQVLSVTFVGIPEPASPLVIDLTASGVTQNGTSVDMTAQYSGINIYIKDQFVAAGASIKAYNRLTIETECYGEGDVLLTTGNNLFIECLYTPFTDWSTWPAWGNAGRLQGSPAPAAGINSHTAYNIPISLVTDPEGIRFERNNGAAGQAGEPLKRLVVKSIKLWHTDYQP